MIDWIIVVLTFFVAFFTYLVWKAYARIEWLTSAMESHSSLTLRLEALRGINGKPIDMVWWDPTIEDVPIVKHGEPVELTKIYVFLPERLRRHKKSTCDKLLDLFRLPT